MNLPEQCAAVLRRATVAALVVGAGLEYRLIFLHLPTEEEGSAADRDNLKTLAVIGWNRSGGLEVEMFPALSFDEKRLVWASRSEFLSAMASLLPGAVVRET